MPKFTICTFTKNKKTLKAAVVAKRVFWNLIKGAQLPLIWINNMRVKSVTESIICEKVNKLHCDLMAKTPITIDQLYKTNQASLQYILLDLIFINVCPKTD